MGLRKCEKCRGAGPTRWDSANSRYCCARCHSDRSEFDPVRSTQPASDDVAPSLLSTFGDSSPSASSDSSPSSTDSFEGGGGDFGGGGASGSWD